MVARTWDQSKKHKHEAHIRDNTVQLRIWLKIVSHLQWVTGFKVHNMTWHLHWLGSSMQYDMTPTLTRFKYTIWHDTHIDQQGNKKEEDTKKINTASCLAYLPVAAKLLLSAPCRLVIPPPDWAFPQHPEEIRQAAAITGKTTTHQMYRNATVTGQPTLSSFSSLASSCTSRCKRSYFSSGVSGVCLSPP